MHMKNTLGLILIATFCIVISFPITNAFAGYSDWSEVENDPSAIGWGLPHTSGYYGYINGVPNPAPFAMVWEKTDPSDDGRGASIDFHISGTLQTILITFLDGIAEDEFDLYIDEGSGNIHVGGIYPTYPHDSATTEYWKTRCYDVSMLGITGPDITIKVYASGDRWPQFSTFGQLGVDYIAVTWATEDDSVTQLQSLSPDLPSYSEYFIQKDVANNPYGLDYQDNYNYGPEDNTCVTVIFKTVNARLEGTLIACNLKPNFAYQVKLEGFPDHQSNEWIGYQGRWWDSDINQNVDDSYYESHPEHTIIGYLLFDYFITDQTGNALLDFVVDSSYHVLWKPTPPTGTDRRTRNPEDGPLKSCTFNPKDPKALQLPDILCYDSDYGGSTEQVYGETERPPVGGRGLPPGDYSCKFILTEESFHSPFKWPAAMGAEISFTIIPENHIPEAPFGTITTVLTSLTAFMLFLYMKRSITHESR